MYDVYTYSTTAYVRMYVRTSVLVKQDPTIEMRTQCEAESFDALAWLIAAIIRRGHKMFDTSL